MGGAQEVHSTGAASGRWQPGDEYDREAVFLNPEMRAFRHRRLCMATLARDASDLPPGKRWQICLLARLLHRHRPVPELQYAGEHHPLFSQPLVELCLRIPLYTLLRGGINRALERAAFRDCVPETNHSPRKQGHGRSIALMSKIREDLPYLRDLMLDGVLVQERIIERSAFEPYLAGNRPMNHRGTLAFLVLHRRGSVGPKMGHGGMAHLGYCCCDDFNSRGYSSREPFSRRHLVFTFRYLSNQEKMFFHICLMFAGLDGACPSPR